MSPYHRHCFCFSFAGCPCKNFIFSHGHLYFSEEHSYFTTDITIFQSIFYKLVIIYFLFVYVWNTLPHIVHKAAIFVRIYPVPCKHFSGQRLSPAEMRFSFTYPDVYLTGIHPCCPTIFPGWGCIFPPFLKRSLPRYLPYKVEGPAARRMQAADPFAIDTVSSGPSLPRCPSGGFTALAASIRRRNRCRNCHRNRRRCRRNRRSPLRWAQQR